MQKIFVFLFCVSSIMCSANIDTCPKCECGKEIILKRMAPDNGRFMTFFFAFKLLCERDAKMIVETGTARYGLNECRRDGCSTALFAEWIKNSGGEFYSVDINPQYLLNAKDGLGELSSFVNFVESDSIPFLENFNKPIDFLYLDSFDYEFGNPKLSQEHHLKEIIAAYRWLTPKCVVMIDDCALPEGGKGKLVIEYLLARDWKILVNEYQVILSR